MKKRAEKKRGPSPRGPRVVVISLFLALVLLVLWLELTRLGIVKKAPESRAPAPATQAAPAPPGRAPQQVQIPARADEALLERIATLNREANRTAGEGDLLAAEAKYRELLELIAQGGPALDHWKAPTSYALARCLLRQKKTEQARELLFRLTRDEAAAGRPPGLALAQAHRLLAMIILREGRVLEAKSHFTRAREAYLAVSGPESPRVREMDAALAELSETGPAPARPASAPSLPSPREDTFHLRIYRDFSPTLEDVGGRWTASPVSLSGEAPRGLLRLPAFSGKKQLYGVIRLGSGSPNTFDMAFDVGGQPHPLLYVDLNQNKDLTDDGGPLRNQGTGVFAALIAFDLERVLPGYGQKGEYPIWLFTGGSYWAEGKVNFYSKLRLEGRLAINGKEYAAGISETGINDGDFTNDGIFVDLNENGRFEESEYAAPGRKLTVGGKSYGFSISE